MNRFLALAMFSIPSAQACSQVGQADIHSGIAEFIKTRAPTPLPSGDTLVSWNGGNAVLFHTASRDSSGVRAGMIRADRMLGTAEVSWHDNAPQSFVVRWLTPRQTTIDSMVIRGTVGSGRLRITRLNTPDTVLAVPKGLWAVADYGMEELLLPVFDTVSDSTTRVEILRPYGMKWDLLYMRVRSQHSGWRVVEWVDSKNESWTATTMGQHLLWLRRSEHLDNEKIPLEGTKLREDLDRIRTEVESASRPSRPNTR